MSGPVQLWTALGCRSCARAKALLNACSHDWMAVDVAETSLAYARQVTIVPAVVLPEARVILSGIDRIQVSQ